MSLWSRSLSWKVEIFDHGRPNSACEDILVAGRWKIQISSDLFQIVDSKDSTLASSSLGRDHRENLSSLSHVCRNCLNSTWKRSYTS